MNHEKILHTSSYDINVKYGCGQKNNMEPFREAIMSQIHHHNYCLVGVTSSGRVLRLDPAHRNSELYKPGRILEFQPNGDPSGPCRIAVYERDGTTKLGDDYLFL